ncbi:MAG: asparagine synthase (glutamine-hydrolyzing) [Anaerolineae bacterium]|nr:asparagine synthase (glutamine-hydrolyzing) [Anaerolineae bacterium]
MCGIIGKLSLTSEPITQPLVKAMCDVIAHRGPDDWGAYVCGPVGLGNRRLSIIDLEGGHQPISNEDETIWIVFNGEIYNFPELRQELEQQGHDFRTHTDTEVIVHLYEEHGVDCLQRLNGMFAFALWDEPRQRLFVARDRLGEKPLVYSLRPDGLTFGSEIQSILCDSDVPRELDLQALDLYLTLLYIPAPWTIFKHIRKLLPGHYLLAENGQVSIQRYWQLDFGPKTALSTAEAGEAILRLLEDSTRRRMISDVPLGAFLSGGIDSSTVVALMSRVSPEPVRTFSVGFEGNDFKNDELPYARLVAERYGTRHEELWVRPHMADVLPKLVHHYGEPFADGSALPTYYISQAARQQVTVVLTGDGGDELFGGYGWYQRFAAFDLRRELGQTWGDGLRRSAGYLRSRDLWHALGTVKGTAAWSGHLMHMERDPVTRYGQQTAYFQGDLRQRVYSSQVINALRTVDPLQVYRDRNGQTTGWEALNRIFYLDHTTYLPDDILAKVDIASMACSLETRPPFLDHRLVELAASLPVVAKVNNGQTKVLLRQVVADLLPHQILERPKVGFGLPMRQWMQAGELHDLAADLLHGQTFRQRDLFSSATVAEMFSQHQSGERDYGHQLYQLLVFELWARAMLDEPVVRGVQP